MVMKEKIHEKYAWIIFVVLGILVLATAPLHALGYNTDPELVKSISGMTPHDLKDSSPLPYALYSFYLQSGGMSDIFWAFLLIVISVTAYRRGEKWAWYAFWFVPAWYLGYAALSLTLESSDARSGLVPYVTGFAILSLVGLLLPFRKFFPRKANPQG